MSDMRIAEVTVTLRLPYGTDTEEDSINWRARRITDDQAFLASWYDVEPGQLRENEDVSVSASVRFEA